MVDFYLKVSLPYITNLPRDVTQFSIAGTAVTLNDPSVLKGAVEEFFNVAPPVLPAVGTYYSGAVRRGVDSGQLSLYALNLATGQIGEPQLETGFDFTVSPTSGVELPEEIALCSSLLGVGAAVPRRRKGRIYLGPFNLDANDGTGQVSRPSFNLRSSILAATERLQQTLQAEDITWCVWSRANAALYPIGGGWVDNAWDTQRRRGVEASERTLWTLV